MGAKQFPIHDFLALAVGNTLYPLFESDPFLHFQVSTHTQFDRVNRNEENAFHRENGSDTFESNSTHVCFCIPIDGCDSIQDWTCHPEQIVATTTTAPQQPAVRHLFRYSSLATAAGLDQSSKYVP
jgi:hypothetical protein